MNFSNALKNSAFSNELECGALKNSPFSNELACGAFHIGGSPL